MAVHTQHRGGALIGTLCLVLSAATAQAENAQAENADVPSSLAALGEALFHDTDLSANRSQACASCHDPALAFTDPRETEVGRAVSLGDNGQALGDRNAPSVTYAAAVPRFGHDAEGHPVGGLFWDGRAASLVEQAGGPPLNPLEMGLADAAALQARLQEKPAYVSAFGTFIGPQALATPEAALASFGQAIQAFEATPAVSSFDSKYDRWLAGSYQMTPQEELGRVLFFSQQFTNCNQCHQLRADPLAKDETFSNYRFHNIGVPANAAVRAANGVTARDLGLAQAVAGDPGLRGQFRVPSLRNVAVTGPYMHNGAFADLRTVVLFYDKYNAKAAKRQLNPETGQPWGAPEVEGTLSLTELEHGPALDDKRIDAIVAFLRTLTDARYEALLPE